MNKSVVCNAKKRKPLNWTLLYLLAGVALAVILDYFSARASDAKPIPATTALTSNMSTRQADIEPIVRRLVASHPRNMRHL